MVIKTKVTALYLCLKFSCECFECISTNELKFKKNIVRLRGKVYFAQAILTAFELANLTT